MVPEIVFIKSDETVDEVMGEVNVNVDDVCTGDKDGDKMTTGDPRLVFIGTKEDVVDRVLTTSRDSVLETVRANEVDDDEAEVMVDVKADDRAKEVDSTARAHEMLCFFDGRGPSIPDTMETYGEKMEERSGKDFLADLSATIPTRFAEIHSR